MDLAVAVLFEHALSSSHVGAGFLAWFRGAIEAETGAPDRR
jgi:hypothetical protein